MSAHYNRREAACMHADRQAVIEVLVRLDAAATPASILALMHAGYTATNINSDLRWLQAEKLLERLQEPGRTSRYRATEGGRRWVAIGQAATGPQAQPSAAVAPATLGEAAANRPASGQEDWKSRYMEENETLQATRDRNRYLEAQLESAQRRLARAHSDLRAVRDLINDILGEPTLYTKGD